MTETKQPIPLDDTVEAASARTSVPPGGEAAFEAGRRDRRKVYETPEDDRSRDESDG